MELMSIITIIQTFYFIILAAINKHTKECAYLIQKLLYRRVILRNFDSKFSENIFKTLKIKKVNENIFLKKRNDKEITRKGKKSVKSILFKKLLYKEMFF